MSDHPRACGENVSLTDEREGEVRITPAHAGKTATTSMALIRTSDHPRACGENDFTEEGYLSISGSPPRMRGKHNSGPTQVGGGWITPAHAGKTI